MRTTEGNTKETKLGSSNYLGRNVPDPLSEEDNESDSRSSEGSSYTDSRS